MSDADMTATFRGVNALTGSPLEPSYSVSSLADVDRVCSAAAGAFDPYRAKSAESRAAFIEAIGEEILGLGDALIERVHAESGLPVARLTGERGRTVGQLKLFAQVVRDGHWRSVRIDPAQTERQPLPRPDLRLRMVPLGPVAVFGASNFPLAFSTAGGDTASALAAGCPVIVKGHPAHPGTDDMVAGAIRRAAARTGMPGGVFGHVRGPANDLGAALVQDPRVAAVGFTGSRGAGLALMKLAQARAVPIPVYAEMSSINPVVLMPAALNARSAVLGRAFVASLTMGAGQFCTNPGLVLAIEGEGLNAFIAAAAEALTAHAPQPMLTGGIRRGLCKAHPSAGKQPGGDGDRLRLEGDGVAREMARLFTTDAVSFLADEALSEEVFGASSLVVRCRDLDDLRAVIAGLEGQLTATVHMDEADHAAAATLVPLLEKRLVACSPTVGRRGSRWRTPWSMGGRSPLPRMGAQPR